MVILLEKHLHNPRMGENTLLGEFFHHDLDNEFCYLGEIRDAIDEFKVVRKLGKCDYIDKIIGFVYTNIMNIKTEKVKSPFLATCIDNIKGL